MGWVVGWLWNGVIISLLPSKSCDSEMKEYEHKIMSEDMIELSCA